MVESSRDHEVRNFFKELDKMLMVVNNFSANLNRGSSQSNSVSVVDETQMPNQGLAEEDR